MTTIKQLKTYNGMSNEVYSVNEPKIAKRHISSKEKLYALIEEGLEDVRQGRVKPWDEVITNIRKSINQR
jgi:predicted transcriptional regulator